MTRLIENVIAILCVFVMGVSIWLVAGRTVFAQTNPPPVEVHIQEGDTLYMYDCYPTMFDENPPQNNMIVYLNYEEGTQGYLCNYAAGAHIIPGLPRWPVIRVSLGHYELLFFLVRS